MSALAPTSTPWVGSSRSSTLGRWRSHLASTTFCWLPPDSFSSASSLRGGPEQHGRHLLPARPGDPGDAEDLAGMQVQVEVADDLAGDAPRGERGILAAGLRSRSCHG